MRDDGLRCWSCGYNLTGNISGRCPECGRTLNRASVPGLKSIFCPACDCDLTRVHADECPDCGRLFDHDEMLRRASWQVDDASRANPESVIMNAPLVKLGPVGVAGRAVWPDDLTDSPARLRPFTSGIWPFTLISQLLGTSSPRSRHR